MTDPLWVINDHGEQSQMSDQKSPHGTVLRFDIESGFASIVVVGLGQRSAEGLAVRERLRSLWSVFELDAGVDVVTVEAIGIPVAPSPAEVRSPTVPGPSIGPRSCGLLKPLVVGLTGDAANETLEVVADADIVIATRQVELFDTSVDGGQVAAHAVYLWTRFPTHNVTRMALLGRHGALTAERALQLGIVTEIVELPLGERLRSAARPFLSRPYRSTPPC